MKKIFTSLVMAAAALTAFAQAPTLYLRGSLPGWNASDCTDEWKFSSEDGEHYTLTVPELSGDFKIATNTWNQYNLGSVSNVELDKEYTLTNNSMSGNINLKDNSATNATIELTLSTLTMKITGQGGVFTYPDLYVVGDLTGWAEPFPADAKMERNDNVYTKKYASFPAGAFKVAADKWAPNFGAENTGDEVAVGTEFTCANNGTDITNPTDLTNVVITFTYNREGASTLLITSDSSVEGIAVEEAAAEYYTIDGVRVANPDKGIYIVRKGDKVSKVIR